MSSGDVVSASSKTDHVLGSLACQLGQERGRVHRQLPVEPGVELLRPLELIALLLRELLGAARRGPALLAAERALELIGEQGQCQLRVSDKPDVDREVLGDLVRVELDVHHLRRLGEHSLRAPETPRETRTCRRSGPRRPAT